MAQCIRHGQQAWHLLDVRPFLHLLPQNDVNAMSCVHPQAGP
jgi:hypothetical protein